jgi:hypothetical protein
MPRTQPPQHRLRLFHSWALSARVSVYVVEIEALKLGHAHPHCGNLLLPIIDICRRLGDETFPWHQSHKLYDRATHPERTELIQETCWTRTGSLVRNNDEV